MFGMPGWTQIALVALLLIVLFGRGRISSLMGDVAKGIRDFKTNLRASDGDDDTVLQTADTLNVSQHKDQDT